MSKRFVMLVAFVSMMYGCVVSLPEASPQPAPVGYEAAQNRALEIVWHDVYGMPWNAGDTTETYGGPAVFWHFGESCGDGPGWNDADTGYGADKCLMGVYHAAGAPLNSSPTIFTDDPHSHANGADVEWSGGKFSDTCLAHELGHARQWYLSGDGDGDHKGGPFLGSHLCDGADEPDSLVAKATAALIQAGL